MYIYRYWMHGISRIIPTPSYTYKVLYKYILRYFYI